MATVSYYAKYLDRSYTTSIWSELVDP